MSGFEVFTKRMVPLAKQPYVTIQRRGVISLNAAAHAAIGSPEAIELLYDRDERLVGLRAVDATAEHAYPIRGQAGKPSGPFMVSGTAFVRHYGIDTSASRRWLGSAEDGLLVIDLKQPGTVVTSNRGGTSSKDASGASG